MKFHSLFWSWVKRHWKAYWTPLRKRKLNLLIRSAGFSFCVLLVYPILLGQGLVSAGNLSQGIRATFLFKHPVYFWIGCLGLMILRARQLEKRGELLTTPFSGWREFLSLFLAGAICLGLGSWTQLDLNRILNEDGISFEDQVAHYDTKRFGVIHPILSNRDPEKNQFVGTRRADKPLMKQMKVEGELDEPSVVIGWYGKWVDENRDGRFNDGQRVWMGVSGGRKYEITEQFRSTAPQRPMLMELAIPADEIRSLMTVGPDGKKMWSVILSKEGGEEDRVGWVCQDSYLMCQTYWWDSGSKRWQLEQFMEGLVFVKRPNGILYSILFKLGYLLRCFGMLLLMMAFLGRRWVLGYVKESPVKSALVFGTAPILYGMAQGIVRSIPILSQWTAWIDYGLLHIGGIKPTIYIADAGNTFIGALVGKQGVYLNLAQSCVGAEMTVAFLLIYDGLMMFNLRAVKIKELVIATLVGISGAFFVNALRIYFIWWAGYFWGQRGFDVFHTHLGPWMFGIYFLVFWWVSMPYVLKEGYRRKDLTLAPGAVSGVLLFLLLMGQEMLSPTSVGYTVCDPVADDNVVRYTWVVGRDRGNCPRGQRQVVVGDKENCCRPGYTEDDEERKRVFWNHNHDYLCRPMTAVGELVHVDRIHCIPEFEFLEGFLSALDERLRKLFS